LEEFGVDGSEAGQTLVEFLGKKQVLEIVEFGGKVLLGYAVDSRVG
jgi:hypothetical protein